MSDHLFRSLRSDLFLELAFFKVLVKRLLRAERDVVGGEACRSADADCPTSSFLARALRPLPSEEKLGFSCDDDGLCRHAIR